MPAYEFVPASSVADAIAIIRQRYPQAHWGTTWQSGVAGESLPVWADAGTNLRYNWASERMGGSRWRTCGGRGCGWTGRSTDEFVPTVKQVVPANVRPDIGRSKGGDAPPYRGVQGPARNYSGVFHRSSLDPGRNWRPVCATGARSEPVRNALGESVRRTLEHRTTAGGTWQFVVKMTQR